MAAVCENGSNGDLVDQLQTVRKISFDMEVIEMNDFRVPSVEDAKFSKVENDVSDNSKDGKDSENDTLQAEKKLFVDNKWWAIADYIVSCIVIAPLVVGSWKGLWCFMDIYPQYFPALPTAFFGIILHTSFAISRYTN